MDFARTADQMYDAMQTDDVEMDQAAEIIPELDPMTKQPLQNPVRNKKCKHIYGKESVIQSLQQNPRLRYVNNTLLAICYGFPMS